MDYGEATKAIIDHLRPIAADNGVSEASLGPIADSIANKLGVFLTEAGIYAMFVVEAEEHEA